MPIDMDDIVKRGKRAIVALKKIGNRSWNLWMEVGDMYLAGREWSMHQAGTNKPEGKGYNVAFSEWLHTNKLQDDIPGNLKAPDRHLLFKVMENRGAIEDWRATMDPLERGKYNHPTTVWRKWKASTAPEKPKSKKPSQTETLTDANVALQNEVDNLKAHVAELEAAREKPLPGSDLWIEELFDDLGALAASEDQAEECQALLTEIGKFIKDLVKKSRAVQRVAHAT